MLDTKRRQAMKHFILAGCIISLLLAGLAVASPEQNDRDLAETFVDDNPELLQMDETSAPAEKSEFSAMETAPSTVSQPGKKLDAADEDVYDYFPSAWIDIP